MSDLSPTAYAILGLLAAGPWSAYELARHMKQSSNLRQLWPRAESKIYEAPKALRAAGLASSRSERVGGRRRTVYRITARGRRALRAWLGEPGAPLYTEYEDALKVAYATAGDLEQLRANLRRMREGQLAESERMLARLTELLKEDFTVPERIHTSALVAELVKRVGYATAEWLIWVEETIADWNGVELDADKEAWARMHYAGIARETANLLETARADFAAGAPASRAGAGSDPRRR
jgi:DNA-binding PadR family transcriptional regulator